MRVLSMVIQFIYSIYAFLVFLILMFILFPFAVVASLFGKINGGNSIYMICRLWAEVAMRLWGIFPKRIYESPLEKNKPAVFVFNHISYMDIPSILSAMGSRHYRILAKSEMAKIPVFGFFYRTAAVMVDRSDPDKRAESISTLIAFLKHNISVVIAPEGTFNMSPAPLKSFYNGAFRIAIETNTPVRPMLFLDTYSRMNYKSIFSMTPGISRTVFLPEIPVEGYGMDDVEKLKAVVFDKMQQALIRYHANWIKND